MTHRAPIAHSLRTGVASLLSVMLLGLAPQVEAAEAGHASTGDGPRAPHVDGEPRSEGSAGYVSDEAEALIGLGYSHPLRSNLRLVPNAELADGGDYWSLNVDSRYHFARGGFTPWVGGGVGVVNRDRGRRGDDTDPALNLLFGGHFADVGGGFQPYVRAKVVASDDSELALTFGVRLPPY